MMERELSARRVYDGRLLKIDVVDVELEDGARATREVVRHPGAAAVLPVLPDGRIVLVRQFRRAAGEELLEVVAGTLEPGEPPEDCARREVAEEAGYAVDSLQSLGIVYPAPGYTEERIYLYRAAVSRRESLPADTDERIDVVIMTPAEVDAAILSGAIRDAKTVSAWHHHRLRERRPAC